jgi:hypothetical protein
MAVACPQIEEAAGDRGSAAAFAAARFGEASRTAQIAATKETLQRAAVTEMVHSGNALSAAQSGAIEIVDLVLERKPTSRALPEHGSAVMTTCPVIL